MICTSTHCHNSITHAIYAHQYCSEYCRLLDVDVLLLCLADQEQGSTKYVFLVSKLISSWTLSEYLTWLNLPNPDPNVITFPLTEDLDHWAEYGITTAEHLGMHLDACCDRERQKGAIEWGEKYSVA